MATIVGTGIALPGAPIASASIARAFGLNAEWAEHFTGNRSRYLSVDMTTRVQFETLEGLGAKAALGALEQAQLDPRDLDFIVLATATPDELMPSTANRIAVRLGISHIPVYQVQSGCAGAVQALELGRLLLSDSRHSYGLVIGGDVCARHFEIGDDMTSRPPAEVVNYLLFGDGAGAVVISSDDVDFGVRVVDIVHETTVAGETAGQVIRWYGQADIADENRAPALREDYKMIETLVPELATQVLADLLARQGWTQGDLSYLLPPQLAGAITERIAKRLSTGDAKIVNCVADTGNCGNALPFLQLHEVFGDVGPGQRVACVCIESSMWITGGIALEGAQ